MDHYRVAISADLKIVQVHVGPVDGGGISFYKTLDLWVCDGKVLAQTSFFGLDCWVLEKATGNYV